MKVVQTHSLYEDDSISSSPKNAFVLSLKYFTAEDGRLAQIPSNALQGLKKRVTLHPCLGLGCSHSAPYWYYNKKSFPSARQHFTPDLDKYNCACEAEEMEGNTFGLSFFSFFFFPKYRPERQELGEGTWIPIMRGVNKTHSHETPRGLHWIETHSYQ